MYYNYDPAISSDFVRKGGDIRLKSRTCVPLCSLTHSPDDTGENLVKLKTFVLQLVSLAVVVFLYSNTESTDSAAQKAPSHITLVQPKVATQSNTAVKKVVEKQKKSIEKPKEKIVVSSYYGGEKHGDFHGKTMANGERFDKHDPTIAASNTIALGSTIKVTNTENDKSIVMTVKDRGGFEKYGRELDVSKAAAEKLGFVKEGTTTVAITVLKKPKAKSSGRA